MKLFGNQQFECLQGYIFSRQKRTHIYIYIYIYMYIYIYICIYIYIYIYIYILDPPSHHKKGSLPHNFHSFSNFSGYLEVLGIWMYLFENITLFFVHFAGLGTFTRFPHSITLTKVSFPYKNCDFGHIPGVDRLLEKRTPLMVLNRQWECGFSKGSPSLINTFVLSPRWAASWNACNCHWLERMFIFFF